MAGLNYNGLKSGGKGESDGFREKGKVEKPKPNYKETCNPSADVKKLKQQKGAE